MTEKLQKIIKEVEEMSVLELNALVKAFEEKFGVSATAVTSGPAVGASEVVEEKSTVSVELTDGGPDVTAVADTPNFSSNALTSAFSSKTDISSTSFIIFCNFSVIFLRF